jgi:aspartate/methionine/tyrosine aminotransferase
MNCLISRHFSGNDLTQNDQLNMRELIQGLEESKIREVANAALGHKDVLAFWFGESDEITPEVVRRAAIASLELGETFYTHNLGLMELRQKIAAHMSQRHSSEHQGIGVERIAVTSGGVNALMIAAQALITPGDDVVAITPLWPNLCAQARIMGANLIEVHLSPESGAWVLDMQRLLSALGPSVKLLILNAPNNPTGWTLTREEQRIILDHCRSRGIWIVADEVYESLYYEDTLNGCAPSFLDVSHPQDKLIVVHSFSKSFLMTGWRLGWMVVPESILTDVGKLIEFNTSCASLFTQRAGVVALEHAHVITPRVVAHLKLCRDTVCDALSEVDSVEISKPKGGMYAFFKIAGHTDSLLTAKKLVQEAGLGIAPGLAFAHQSREWFRWCFASKDPARLNVGVDRLKTWLIKN